MINLKENGYKVVYFLLIYYMVSYVLCYAFNLNKILVYLGDIINIFLFLIAFSFNKKVKQKIKIANPIFFMILFTMFGILSNFINYEKSILLIWGVKNILRFYMFFYSTVVLVNEDKLEFFISILKFCFFSSLPLCIYQHFFVKYPVGTIIGDQVGGIFLSYSGCNTPLHCIILLYSSYVILNYFKNKVKFSYFFIVTISSLLMAILAELKVYIAEYLFIILLSCVQCKISVKSLFKITFLAFLLSFSISYFIAVNDNGHNYSDNFSLSGFFEIATRKSGYDGVGDLNRLTGIGTINKTIFKNHPMKKIFGIGIGNAEFTNFYTSDFYRHNNKLHYQWFHAIWLYIENGFIGLVLFISMLLSIFLDLRKISNCYYYDYVKICLLFMFILLFYNTSLRVESSGFLLYFIMAIPYICEKGIKYEKDT